MTLVARWRRVLRYAWSIRLALLASAFGGAEVAVNILTADPPLPRGTFAAIAAVVSAGASIARLIAQPSLHDGEDSK